jgi:hypothetical protein
MPTKSIPLDSDSKKVSNDIISYIPYDQRICLIGMHVFDFFDHYVGQ